jgi:hypothetical protein
MIVNGRAGLLVAALLAASGGMAIPKIGSRDDPFERREEPDNRGRRSEKDAISLAKAQAKRERRAAKRIASAVHNAELTGSRASCASPVE